MINSGVEDWGELMETRHLIWLLIDRRMGQSSASVRGQSTDRTA